MGSTEEFDVYIAHNKGAACLLGKGTEWCTAAPGLDYFNNYYKQDDPLFIFHGKGKNTGQKYQFHYGSRQFMDSRDRPIDIRQMVKLHQLLKQLSPNIGERYPKISEYDRQLNVGKSYAFGV